MEDIIIIGAGAAGITAAIYAARANLKFEIISKDVGGLTLWSSDIENYTGYHNLSGIELVEKFKKHMEDYDINIKEDSVLKVEKKENGFLVKTEKEEIETKTVLVCSGSSPRKLNVKGAEKYEGKGLFYCATCDGPLMSGNDVVVIGGGDAALDAANTLLNVANKIYIVNINSELTGTDKALVDNVIKSGKVSIINNAETKEIVGEYFVDGLKYVQDGKEKKIDVKGIFVEIGHVRNTDFVKDLVKLNKTDEIIVDKDGKTSADGIFAAGDITDLPGKQTVIACGDGARALLSAFAYISKK